MSGNSNSNKTETYLGLISKTDIGSENAIEFDLVTARQKGQEIRYLAISIEGVNQLNNQPQSAFISIDREAFSQIKEYFSKLEWNS